MPESPARGPKLEARLEQGALKLEFGERRALRLDAEGRWASHRDGDVTLRRCLDGRIRRERRGHGGELVPGDPSLHRQVLDFVQELRALLADASSAVVLELHGAEASHAALRKALERGVVWSPERLVAEAERYAAAYPEAVPILPPDRYRDVVLQPATGCPNAGCTFCAFYRAARFRVLAPEEFDLHVERVRELFGAALQDRNGVFLGSANALAVPQRRLRAVLAQLRAMGLGGRRGIAGFWDPEHAPRRTTADWTELFALGLSRVHLGLETGDPELRASWGKDPELGRWRQDVARAREAGIALGVSVLALGDVDAATHARHRDATATCLEALELGTTDFVYVSPLLDPEAPGRFAAEARELRVALAARTAAKVVPYAAERFGYLA